MADGLTPRVSVDARPPVRNGRATPLPAAVGHLGLERYALWAIAGLILAPVLVRTSADPDLWGHTRFGLDMLESRTLPSVDAYSFTQDIPWVNHEWLSELLMGIAYDAAGPVGLVVLRTLLVAAFAAVVIRSYAGASLLVAGGAFFLVAWGTAYLTATLRPQLWTLLGVALLCRVLTSGPRRWWLVGLPILFAAWVNLHGGWIVGAGLLVVWTAFNFFRQDAPRALIAASSISSALATLLNPYGWHMWGFLADTVRLSRDISEWQPLLTLHVFDWLPWMVTVIVVIVCTVSRHRPALDRLAMMAMLIYASVRVARIGPLFVACAVVLIRPSLEAWAGSGSLKFAPLSRAAERGMIALLVCLTLASAVAVTRVAQCIPIAGMWAPDRAAGRTLADAHLSGTIVTWFNWGEYALWHVGPALRVSMDGRRETIYSDKRLEEHFAFYEAKPEGLEFFKRMNPDYVWLPAWMGRTRDWVASNGYRLDVQTPESFIAVRADKPVLPAALATTEACFPGP